MFTFFRFEVFPNLWVCVIKAGKKVHRIINDKGALLRVLSSQKILVGYGNYKYDDAILWAILYDKNPYYYSKKIKTGDIDDFLFVKLPYITLDAMQELANTPELQEIEAFQGKAIHDIDIDYDRPLTDDRLKELSEFCYRNVSLTEEIFYLRKEYFETKFEIVQTFNLEPWTLRKSQTGLVGEVLQAKKVEYADRLDILYDKRLPVHELPREIIHFYETIRKRWQYGEDAEMLEGLKYNIKIAGVDHRYGFGGVHGARPDYIGNGLFLHIDAKSFYPSLMINNGFISRACASPELFKNLYDTRMKLQAERIPKESIYKLLLNKAFGASKAKTNKMFDARQANNIAINGQLILTHLILVLEPFMELIQSNTDGIIIKYKQETKDYILEIVKRFSEQYELKFEVKEIERIAQRDVNNYVVRYRDGKIKAVGFMSRHTGGNWSRNHLNIIDIASVQYYMEGIEPSRTVIDEYKKGNIEAFQMIVKSGVYDYMAQETKEGHMVKLQRVNRIFAAKADTFEKVYKVRAGKYTSISDCPDHTIVHNGTLESFDKTQLNLRFYIDLVERKLFKESLV